MTDTNKASGADALAALDRMIDRRDLILKEAIQARTAVATLIAERDALAARHAATERDACLQAERANALAKRVAELEIKARLWDSLLAARHTTSNQPETSGWKLLSRDPRKKIEAIKACRAENGLSLREAIDCVEGYINSLQVSGRAEASND